MTAETGRSADLRARWRTFGIGKIVGRFVLGEVVVGMMGHIMTISIDDTKTPMTLAYS